MLILSLAAWLYSAHHHHDRVPMIWGHQTKNQAKAMPTSKNFANRNNADQNQKILSALRRDYQPELTTYGEPSVSGRSIELEGLRIYTDGGLKLTIHRESGHSYPYFVQFKDAIQPEWKKQIERQGGIIHGYIPHHTLTVDLSPAAAKHLSLQPFVHWIHPVLSEHKVQPFLRELISLSDDRISAKIPVTISTFTPHDVDTLVSQLSTQSISITSAEKGKRWGWIRATVPRNTIMEIASHERVQWIEEYVAPGIVNNQAVIAQHLNVTNVWITHGLTGSGQIIGHADTGLDIGSMAMLHADLNGRIIAAYDRGRPGRWDDPNGHGTHTAGSIIGNGTMSTGLFRGVAWEAKLVHQSLLDTGGGLGGLPFNLNELYLQTYTNGARIHSDSWGASVFGSYTTSSRQSDEFMWDHPDMLLVFAAGNDGYDGNVNGVIDPDSIGAPATAKNLLTVGAVENDRAPGSGGFSGNTYGGLWPSDYSALPIKTDYVSQSAAISNQGMAAFSSRGPTDDGRMKPDVVAPGTDVISARSRAVGAGSGWGIHPNGNYNFNGGTSMSTPLVAGAASLVRQYFQQYRNHPSPSAALIKGTMMHGARSLFPGQYGTNSFLEIPDRQPNSVEGWGQVDLEGTLFPDQANWFFIDESIGLDTPGQFHTTVFYAEPGPIKITLNYTDFPASAGSGLKLVNDLDLSLTGPEGFLAIPSAGHDHTNNTEQIRYEIPSSGVYTVQVEAINVPVGPQPYSVIISGNVIDQPVIIHEPLINTYLTNDSYLVEANILSSASLNSDAVSLFWKESNATSFTESVMTHLTNGSYTGWIPPHPNGSQLHYYLSVSSGIFVVSHPADAPAITHQFNVTEPYTLTVSATPANIFSVTPGYGIHPYASGNVVRLSAPAYTNINPGIRIAIAGWTGTGSIPAAGSSNDVEMIITEPSAIIWEWVTQHALTQTSTVSGIIQTTTWWNAWSSGSTISAVPELNHAGTNYGLAGWTVDGLRQPDNTSAAINPASGLIMYGPRTAVANYLPSHLDGNTNGLPDWWEQFYFGTNASMPAVDADNDGFTNIKEFQDRTDPRDENSIPQPPSISLIPLINPQTHPAPWIIEAVIVDNYAVSNALVYWQRNGDAWTSSILNAFSTTNFKGVIAGPGTNGDVIAYRVEATDFASLKAVVGPFNFIIEYPTLRAAPDAFSEMNVPDAAMTNVMITISNAGRAQLNWTIDRAAYYDHVESGTGTWTHAGIGDIWHIQTTRYASASHAWHFGNGPQGFYPDSAHAWLITESIDLHEATRLEFQHWAKMEYDQDQNDDHYWDGGIVEISTDGGTTFTMIHPLGGYPHRITDNDASPFPPDTPCYGETSGWEPAMFDLSEYTGDTVRFRIRFGSDGYVTDEGWYIDDIKIMHQDDSSWTWLSVTTNGFIPVNSSSNVTATLDTTGLELGEHRKAVFVVSGNDPELTAPRLIPVALHNASREIFVTHSLNGAVSPSGSVLVLTGGSTNFWISGDEFFTAGSIFTNGTVAEGLAPSMLTNFIWSGLQSNSSLHIEFVESLVDGLVPEWWLFEQGFTNQPYSIEAITDYDGDGMLSWQEYRAGTDPNERESVEVTVLIVKQMVSGDIIEWLSFTNTTTHYEIHASANPMDGFQMVATNIPAAPPVNVFTNEGDQGPHIMYRIRANP